MIFTQSAVLEMWNFLRMIVTSVLMALSQFLCFFLYLNLFLGYSLFLLCQPILKLYINYISHNKNYILVLRPVQIKNIYLFAVNVFTVIKNLHIIYFKNMLFCYIMQQKLARWSGSDRI